MEEGEKITIVEGPPPTFALSREPWLLGLVETVVPYHVAMCRVRTLKGQALVERCQRSWQDGVGIHLEYSGQDGEIHRAPIVSARLAELPEGQVLMLWVCMEESQVEVEFDVDLLDRQEPDGGGDEPDVGPTM